ARPREAEGAAVALLAALPLSPADVRGAAQVAQDGALRDPRRLGQARSQGNSRRRDYAARLADAVTAWQRRSTTSQSTLALERFSMHAIGARSGSLHHATELGVDVRVVRAEPIAERVADQLDAGGRRRALEHVMLPVEEVGGVQGIRGHR